MKPEVQNKEFLLIEPTDAYDQRYCGALLVDEDSQVILQVRDDKPGIANPGMYTIFGGLQEAGESTVECVLRELQEEVTLTFTDAELQLLGYLNKQEADGKITRCTIFCVRGVDVGDIDLQEGQGTAVLSATEALASDKLSEVTKMAIRAAMKQ